MSILQPAKAKSLFIKAIEINNSPKKKNKGKIIFNEPVRNKTTVEKIYKKKEDKKVEDNRINSSFSDSEKKDNNERECNSSTKLIYDLNVKKNDGYPKDDINEKRRQFTSERKANIQQDKHRNTLDFNLMSRSFERRPRKLFTLEGKGNRNELGDIEEELKSISKVKGKKAKIKKFKTNKEYIEKFTKNRKQYLIDYYTYLSNSNNNPYANQICKKYKDTLTTNSVEKDRKSITRRNNRNPTEILKDLIVLKAVMMIMMIIIQAKKRKNIIIIFIKGTIRQLQLIKIKI